jgi:hypothetical protein
MRSRSFTLQYRPVSVHCSLRLSKVVRQTPALFEPWCILAFSLTRPTRKMAGQDASYELESREQIIEARILRLSLVSLPTRPDATMLIGILPAANS